MEVIRKVLSEVWKHINDADWDNDSFDWRKASVCAAFSQLAYLAIPEFEFEERGRFKLIPCQIYQEAIAARRSLVTANTLSEMDIGRSFITFGQETVTIGVRIKNIVFIAVRGTSSLYKSTKMYDWRINLNAQRIHLGNGMHFHNGFLLAAVENLSRIYHELDALIEDDNVQIYVTGHSLGGAVGSILYNILSGALPLLEGECFHCGYPRRFGRRHHFRKDWMRGHFINSAYAFGMPRFGDMGTAIFLRPPYHLFHDEDIVPKMPFKWMGYIDAPNRIRKHANPFQGMNCDKDGPIKRIGRIIAPRMMLDRIMWYHSIENYRDSLDEKLK